ncbi:DUF2271 domain-containing protein [Pseudomaricurvus sp.]|uniref:DUF2271 domain-containing protein n=1 Tax=Pseudomaricurvus sp. TaxID=2004510 RepID=UPI003F6BDE15
MIKKSAFAGLLLMSATMSSYAADLSLSIEIPTLNVAEYHRPYVAAWVQNQETKAITNLAVWYQLDKAGEGNKWLKDMRQWWRRSGRNIDMPADGFTGATRPPGTHQVELNQVTEDLPAGQYRLYVEAAREVGGRELLKASFDWPADQARVFEVQGKTELGLVTLTVSP